MTFFYDINRRLADLDQNKPMLNESQQQVDEKYMGFDKTVAAIKKGGSAENPEAVAAAIGRKKYGKERFQKAAAAGKKLGEQGVAEGSTELGDEFAAMLSGMGKSFRRGPPPRRPETAPRDYSADIAALPELRAQYEELMRKYESLGGSSYQYADREQNLSDRERQARDLWNGPIKELRRKINAAETAQREQEMTEDEMGEGNEFSGALARARATGQKEFEVDGQTYPVNEGRVERTEKGVRHHGTYGTEYQGDDDEDQESTEKSPKTTNKKRGRPAATRDTYNAPFGTVDIPKWKGPKTVHKIGDAEPGKAAPRRGRPKKVKEQQDDMIDIADRGEYDREGDMAHDQLRTIMDASKELRGILKADENLPEWVQSKITKALDYIDTARDYMKSQKSGEVEPVTEKAVSQAQQQAAGIALAARKSGQKPRAGTASAEMAKMPKKELEKFASTSRKGLPKHKDSAVKETTTSGSVATSDATSDSGTKSKKSKGGVSFGKGIYDSWNRELEQMISESMNITVTQSTSETGEIDKSISVNATGDDAHRLAELLNLAGMEGDHSHDDHSCPTCGQEPCGCSEIVDENSPDWPTDTEYNQDSLQYSGGLNRPKSTGQTTVPVIASQFDRQMSENTDLDYIKKMLG